MGNVIAKLPKNSNTPEDVLVDIAKSNKNDDSVMMNAMVHKNMPADAKRKLMPYTSDDVRAHVAENDSTSADLLRDLSNDASVHVRRCVAGNKNAPSDVLTKLSMDEHTRRG